MGNGDPLEMKTEHYAERSNLPTEDGAAINRKLIEEEQKKQSQRETEYHERKKIRKQLTPFEERITELVKSGHYKSRAEIAKKLKCSESTLSIHARKLERMGYAIPKKRAGGQHKQKEKTSNEREFPNEKSNAPSEEIPKNIIFIRDEGIRVDVVGDREHLELVIGILNICLKRRK